MKHHVTVASHIVTLLALSLWLGGMIVLGAVVAPIVFSVLPLPTSADAMTLVFRRFDAIAVTSAAIVLACEVWRVKVAGKLRRLEIARGVALAIAGLLALFEGIAVSPRVEALHRAGAIRGVGDLGAQLEAAHKLAESVSKAEALFVVVFAALFMMTASEPL